AGLSIERLYDEYRCPVLAGARQGAFTSPFRTGALRQPWMVAGPAAARTDLRGDIHVRSGDDRRRHADARERGLPRDVLRGAPLDGEPRLRADARRERSAPVRPVGCGHGNDQQQHSDQHTHDAPRSAWKSGPRLPLVRTGKDGFPAVPAGLRQGSGHAERSRTSGVWHIGFVFRLILTAAALAAAAALSACQAPPPEYGAELADARLQKDAEFASSPESPVPPDKRGTLLPLTYYPIDAEYAVPAELELAGSRTRLQMPTSTGRLRDYQRVGTLKFSL